MIAACERDELAFASAGRDALAFASAGHDALAFASASFWISVFTAHSAHHHLILQYHPAA